MQFIIAAAMSSILLFSCAAGTNIETKMDAPLKQRIMSLEKSGNPELIYFLGKCNTPILEDMKKEIESHGVKVETLVKDIFSARGLPDQIKRIASHDFIQKLELSQESQMKKQSH